MSDPLFSHTLFGVYLVHRFVRMAVAERLLEPPRLQPIRDDRLAELRPNDFRKIPS
jgi:hypothetical protein